MADELAANGWTVGLHRVAGAGPLSGRVTADACVIGLGASGLAAIDELAGRGLSVVGLDAGPVAGCAAGRNGGFLLGGPAPFLHDALARWGAAAVDLYRATLAELDRQRALLGPGVIRDVGSVRLAGLPGEPVDAAEADDRAAEAADLALHRAALQAHGIAVQPYAGPLGEGILLPDDAATNPYGRALALAAALPRGVALHEHSPVVEVGAGRVVCARGTVSAGVVVVAVDGRLEVLLPQLAGRMRTTRLQMLATAPLTPGRLPCPVYGRWGYDYAQQTPDGRLFVGGGRDVFVEDEWTVSADPTPGVQGYLDRLAERMAGGPVRVTHRWAASVGYTGDGRPLCVEVASGVVAAGGYSGTGNLVGPVTARAAVELAVDGTPPPAWASS